MNTKEAINFLAYEIKFYPHKAKSLPASLEIYKIVERIEEIIKVFKRGEKYEKMFNEIRKDYYQVILAENNAIVSIGKKMDNIEQRYFPKEK